MHKLPDIDNLVAISAMFENGGNATHRMLDGHPQLLVCPFESQLGTPLVNNHFSSLVPVRYRWPEFSLTGSAEEDYQMIWGGELKTLTSRP